MSIKIGTLIDGRYRITALAGHGGMAEVYESYDLVSKNLVAIKLLKEEISKDSINLKRFENEATIAAGLSHPNIVMIYNHGRVDGRAYIANEYIKGQTLNNTLDFRGGLPIAEAVSYMAQLTSALYYAHRHNVVHRDVKPSNIFLLADGSIKLGDFGIAQADGLNNDLTRTNDIVGSVHYLAPEIVKGKLASPRSDIYAAGITFFELLTGKLPFDKDTPVNVAVAQIKEKFPSIKKFRPDCPKEVEKIIIKATKKNPRERYQTAKEMHDDIINLQQNPSLLEEKKNFFARLFGFK